MQDDQGLGGGSAAFKAFRGIKLLFGERSAFQDLGQGFSRQHPCHNGVKAVFVGTKIDQPVEVRVLEGGKLAEQFLEALDFLWFGGFEAPETQFISAFVVADEQ